MLAKRFLGWLVLAIVLALVVAVALDIFIAFRGGAAFFSWGSTVKTDPGKVLANVRDGVIGNIVFFLVAGVIVAWASWRNPHDEQISLRAMMMFPELDKHPGLLEAFVDTVKAGASISLEAKIELVFQNFDTTLGAWKIRVVRSEIVKNLLRKEAYEDPCFSVTVSADSVGNPTDIIGKVYEAKLTCRNQDGTEDVGKSKSLVSYPYPLLTAKEPLWRRRNTHLLIPADGRAEWDMRYWAMANPAISWVSANKRPTQVIRFTVINGSETGDLTIRCGLQGSDGVPTDIVLTPSQKKEFTFCPKVATPAVRLDFSAPGHNITRQWGG